MLSLGSVFFTLSCININTVGRPRTQLWMRLLLLNVPSNRKAHKKEIYLGKTAPFTIWLSDLYLKCQKSLVTSLYHSGLILAYLKDNFNILKCFYGSKATRHFTLSFWSNTCVSYFSCSYNVWFLWVIFLNIG